MYCKHCGTQTNKTGKFCKSCGKKTPKSSWLKRSSKRLYLVLPIALVVFAYFVNAGYTSAYVDIFPIYPTSPKDTTLVCKYANKNLSVNTTLYGNINNYYANHDYNNRDAYLKTEDFAKFVFVNPKDQTIKKLAGDIKKVASSNGLNDDQSLELAACFMQNIQYDSDKSNVVLKGTGNSADTEQYPYQTLYGNKGICTDKTYLGSALLKEMGYGTGILAFDKDEHMALGISVPPGYSSFGTNYAIMELTSAGFTPGSIPTAVSNGLPSSNINNVNPLKETDDPNNISFDTTKTISAPSKVIDINTGKAYTRIVAVKKLENDILALIGSLDGKKTNLVKANSNISYWNNAQTSAYSRYLAVPATTQTCYPVFSYYPSYSTRQNCYTSTNISKNISYNSYLSSYNSYKSAVANYNNLVADYNKTLDSINTKIKQYQSYEYN